MIETVGLARRFGHLDAVNGLNLQVPQGSTFALFSPSILWPVAIVTEGRPLGFRVDATHFQLPPFSSNVSMPLDPAWLDRAELVIVRVRQAGSVERILDIPAVPLTAALSTPP